MNHVFASAFFNELSKLAGWKEDWDVTAKRHKARFGKAMTGLKERMVGKLERTVHKRLGTGEAKPSLSNTFIRRKLHA